ncbi:hypothetical protein NUW54_g6819 [Trametes sanguinea]|nr:hypothetical protein NUW54_g6819 [Trametes sanguinea]
MIDPTLCLAVLVVFYAVYQAAAIICNVFFHPLSAIPGPWYAAASDTWLLLHAAKFMQVTIVHDLFRRYGPIVRIGPRRIVIRDHATMKSVYCVNKLHKSTFYKALIAYALLLLLFAPWSADVQPTEIITTIR